MLQKITLFTFSLLLTLNAYAMDYCKMYGEDDVLCESQRMQMQMGDPRQAVERARRTIKRCYEENDVIACHSLCNDGVPEACHRRDALQQMQ